MSNFALDELSAYQAHLDGENAGLLKLHDSTRDDIKNRILNFQVKYEKRLDYERRHNLNPDGTPQAK